MTMLKPHANHFLTNPYPNHNPWPRETVDPPSTKENEHHQKNISSTPKLLRNRKAASIDIGIILGYGNLEIKAPIHHETTRQNTTQRQDKGPTRLLKNTHLRNCISHMDSPM